MHPDRMVRLSKAGMIVAKITGEPAPSPSTIHRWALRGLKGVRLRTAYAGGQRRTTEDWVREFFSEVTAAADGERIDRPKSSSRESSIRRAERELAEAGI